MIFGKRSTYESKKGLFVYNPSAFLLNDFTSAKNMALPKKKPALT